MSSVMRKGLPRPSVIKPALFAADESTSHAERLINEEMLVLMVHDNTKHPLKGMKAGKLPKVPRSKQQFSSEQLEKARQLIAAEAGDIPSEEPWPEHLDAETLWLPGSNELRFRKDLGHEL